MQPSIVLRVLRTSDASIPPAAAFLVARDLVVGPTPDAAVVIAAPAVSRRHLRIERGPPVRVSALTASNGTFCEGARLTPDAPVEVPSTGAQLQLGGVLVALGPLARTDPVWESLSTRGPSAGGLEVVWDAGQCLVRAGGRDLALNGAAARLVGLLVERVGEVVHHWDLQQEVGTPHLAPVASQVRRALAEAHASGAVDLRALAGPGVAPAADEDIPSLCRRLVQSRRGHGYVLHLDPDRLRVRRV